MAHEWKTGYCEYDVVENTNNVKVSALHWACSKQDAEFSGSSYGSVSAADQNRVYTLAALSNVPEHVMTGWVQQALGEEEVQRIEDAIDAQIVEAKTPTSGGLTPS